MSKDLETELLHVLMNIKKYLLNSIADKLKKYINIQYNVFVYKKEELTMATTVRINEDVKQQLKIKCVELGVKQIDLVNRYIIEGIKRDTTPKKSVMSLNDLEIILNTIIQKAII